MILRLVGRWGLSLPSIALVLSLAPLLSGCSEMRGGETPQPETEPRYLEVLPSGEGFKLVSISPFDGAADTLLVDRPFRRLVTMSTSHIGFLCAVGAGDAVVGVSGLGYVCDTSLVERASRGLVAEVGYEAAPDFERILSLKPDLVLTYSVSASESSFASKLEALGLRVFTIHEHLERRPLARASYIRLFGALTGKMQESDSVFASVCSKYKALRATVGGEPRKALLNIPYNDQWFIPTQESYIYNLLRDAGATVLGASASGPGPSVVSLERAYSLSKEADCWLNVSWCRSLEQLLSVHPAFGDFFKNISSNARARALSGPVVWNDNRRLGPGGGNDIWESGVVHPELVLEDLIRIFHPGRSLPSLARDTSDPAATGHALQDPGYFNPASSNNASSCEMRQSLLHFYRPLQ